MFAPQRTRAAGLQHMVVPLGSPLVRDEQSKAQSHEDIRTLYPNEVKPISRPAKDFAAVVLGAVAIPK